MKKLLSIIFVVLTLRSYSQTHLQKPVPTITAKEAYKHVGERVIVEDSIYNGEVKNDSIVVFNVGKKTDRHGLIMYFIVAPKFRPLDKKSIVGLERNKVGLYSTIRGTKDAPEIRIHHNTDEFSFVNLAHR